MKPQRDESESGADVGAWAPVFTSLELNDNYPPVPFFRSVHDRSIKRKPINHFSGFVTRIDPQPLDQTQNKSFPGLMDAEPFSLTLN